MGLYYSYLKNKENKMEKYIIPNLKNACRVLKYLADTESGEVIGTITKDLKIPRTTVLRILTTLQSEELVSLNDKKYTLGGAMVHLGINAMNSQDLQSLAQPILKELSIDAQETSHLAVPSGYNTLIQDVVDSPNPVRASSRPGAIAPLHCSSTGKVFLAYKFAEKVEEIYATTPICVLTDKTASTLEQIQKNIEETLVTGCGLDDEEYAMGVRCIAAPIYNAQNEVIAAIGITASTSTFTKKRISVMSKKVQKAASKVSALLGCTI